MLALTAGPASYTLATAATPHTGSTPASGPSGVASSGPGAGGFGGARVGGGGGTPPSFNGTPPSGASGTFTPPTGSGGFGGGTGAAGGGRTASTALVTLLKQDSSIHTWAAATLGAQSAASLQLASGQSVMAIGGFTGSDPSPTLAQFEKLVAQGKIHWFIAGGGMGGGPGGGTSSTSSIATWVANHFTARTVGGQTVYDLTKAT